MTISLDLTAQVALITGGAKGVGRGIAARLLDAGADVVTCARPGPDEPVRSGGRQASFVATDVRDPDAVAVLVERVVERYGRLDVVVNNAGGSPPAEAATASARFSAAVIGLNLEGPLAVAQQANAVMQGQDGGGAIVNIASLSGVRPSPGTAAYGAAKAGLISLTQSLAVEWAPRVRVNAVVAGMVRTEQSHLHYGDDEGIARVGATIPLGRLAEPTDIGDACAFLASSLAVYVSGATLEVPGGGDPPPFLSAADPS